MKAIELAHKLLDAAVQFGNLEVCGYNCLGAIDEIDAVIHLHESDQLAVLRNVDVNDLLLRNDAAPASEPAAEPQSADAKGAT
jgi:hypothetical protein